MRLAHAFALLLLTGQNEGRSATSPASHDVEIIGRDYAFSAPTHLAAGWTTFHFVNQGKVIHEMHVTLLKRDATPTALIAAVNAHTPIKPFLDETLGLLIAHGGRRSSSGLTGNLLPGRDYVVVCRFQDADSAPEHMRLGMISFIHVTAGQAAEAAMPARVDTIVGADYAFKTRPTIASGRHTIAFVNEGKQKHEMNILLLKRGLSADSAFALIKSGGDLIPVVDEWMGVLFAAPAGSSSGTLTMTLIPGRDYLIKCDLADSPGATGHVHLGMYAVIRAVK